MLPEAVPRRRVARVQGREDIESSRQAYEAAWALGISLVMIDQVGHWLQDDNWPYAHLREAFIPISQDKNRSLSGGGHRMGGRNTVKGTSCAQQ